MSRRKGELTATLVGREWPHQVALPEEACTGRELEGPDDDREVRADIDRFR